MNIVLIEPYYTGSHKLWADQLIQHSEHTYKLITLPGRYWKWRMQGSAIELATRINQLESVPDLFVTTDMMNVSLFKSLLNNRFTNIPIALYFHENQLVYPKSENDKDKELNRDLAYAFINYTSGLVADRVIFNSHHHFNIFFESLYKFVGDMPDFENTEFINEIKSKSTVIHPGIESFSFERETNQVPVILWNHRWEYDKNPDLFFQTLFKLQEQNVNFRLIVMGEHSNIYPDIFNMAKRKLSDKILHWGYIEDREAYWKMLHQADILPVTSIQENFGISVLEAMASGVIPILPNRLVYPEHVPSQYKNDFFYRTEKDFYNSVKKLVLSHADIQISPAKWVDKYSWDSLSSLYDLQFKLITK